MIRASDLTGELIAPSSSSISEAVRTQLRRRLASGVVPLVERLPPGEQVVVTLSLLRKIQADPDVLGSTEEAFTWKPVFVRRSLGLAAVKACVSGRFPTPSQAVEPVAFEAVTAWERTGWRTFHWEPWFAGLGRGARALVMAEAVSWATALWSALDWTRFRSDLQIGGADDQWVCPASRTVRLKSRSELRVPLLGASGQPTATGQSSGGDCLVSVTSGCPGPGWSEELAYLALVAALRSPSRPVPARVAGLWPDAGVHLTVEIGDGALVAAAERVEHAIAIVVAARMATEPHA